MESLLGKERQRTSGELRSHQGPLLSVDGMGRPIFVPNWMSRWQDLVEFEILPVLIKGSSKLNDAEALTIVYFDECHLSLAFGGSMLARFFFGKSWKEVGCVECAAELAERRTSSLSSCFSPFRLNTNRGQRLNSGVGRLLPEM